MITKPTIYKVSDKVKDCIIIQNPIHYDFRGENFEGYNFNDYDLIFRQLPDFRDKNTTFPIDSFSRSSKNVARGLHGDKNNYKIISVLHGDVYFVVLDIRPNSETHGSYETIQLNDKNRLSVLVPKNCVNGHIVLSKNCLFWYKLSQNYVSQNEQLHVKWDDERYNIFLPIDKKSLIFSERDE